MYINIDRIILFFADILVFCVIFVVATIIVALMYRKRGGYQRFVKENGDPFDGLCNVINTRWPIIVLYEGIYFPIATMALLGAKAFSDLHYGADSPLTIFLVCVSAVSFIVILMIFAEVIFYLGGCGCKIMDTYIKVRWPLEYKGYRRGMRGNARRHRLDTRSR